jgi:signal peptidase I
LKGIELFVSQRLDVVNTAAKYARPIQYLEKKSDSQLDDFQANAGSGNYTKFNRDFSKIVGWSLQAQPWCAIFVSMVFVETFGTTEAKQMLAGNVNASCPNWVQQFQKANQYKRGSNVIPNPGDIIFFTEPTNNNKIPHVGLVEKVENNKVYTIEGNTSSSAGVVPNGGAVAAKSYAIGYNRIHGYGIPKFKEDDLQVVIDQIVKNTGKTEAEVIDALSYLIKNANVTEEPWEKDAITELYNDKIINSTRAGNAPVTWGEFSIIIDRTLVNGLDAYGNPLQKKNTISSGKSIGTTAMIK